MQSIVTLTINDSRVIPELTVNDAKVTPQLTVSEVSQPVNLTVTDAKGEPGASAYQLWLGQGNEGSLEQFMASLGQISADPNNQATRGTDGGLFVAPTAWGITQW